VCRKKVTASGAILGAAASMRTLRSRLNPIALAGIGVYAALISLPATGLCAREQHTHANGEACPMHRQAPAAAPASESHHTHHGPDHDSAVSVPDVAATAARIECGCAAEQRSFLIGHVGLLGPAATLDPLALTATLIRPALKSLHSRAFEPLSPPPRLARS
jgi:hypothetical protein